MNITSGGFLSDIEVENDLNECFGKGKMRQIRPGENAICLEQMNSLIDEANHD